MRQNRFGLTGLVSYAAPPPPPPAYAPPPYRKERTGLPVAAGALLIVTGILGLIGGIYYLFIFLVVGGAVGFFFPELGAIIAVCGSLGVIFAIIALLGGIFAIKRRKWALALIGSILGLFTAGFWVSSILALVALILIAISHEEFEK
ncbi:MAG: hypothetical protein AB1485_03290 [Candidatus Thermoplasmatota archaeon]